MQRKDVAIVVIGRNEGDRLRRCLAAIEVGFPVIYVDSGSTDASVEHAVKAGAQVISLDVGGGFTAARARNAGLAAVGDPAIAYVQMVDGDCALEPGWIERAAAALDDDRGLGAVFGRRRERAPDASVYNWLCDLEWAVAPGPALVFGGDVMIRRAALDVAGRYDDAMIAGEDIDLALRIGGAGAGILCLPAEMTSHDAALLRFGQWWRRSVRAGHGFAELASRHPGLVGAPYRRSVGRICFWGIALPALAVAGLVVAPVSATGLALAIAAVGLSFLNVMRMAVREARNHGWSRGIRFAGLFSLGKYAEAVGLLRFVWARMRRRRSALIEYKGERT